MGDRLNRRTPAGTVRPRTLAQTPRQGGDLCHLPAGGHCCLLWAARAVRGRGLAHPSVGTGRGGHVTGRFTAWPHRPSLMERDKGFLLLPTLRPCAVATGSGDRQQPARPRTPTPGTGGSFSSFVCARRDQQPQPGNGLGRTAAEVPSAPAQPPLARTRWGQSHPPRAAIPGEPSSS